MKRPPFSATDAVRLARELFHLDVDADSLPGDRDRNFKLLQGGQPSHVLKVVHADEPDSVLDLQRRVFDHVGREAPGLRIPSLVGVAPTNGPDGQVYRVVLMHWLPGKPLAKYRPHDDALMTTIGRRLGQLDLALETLDAPEADRPFSWDLRGGVATARAGSESVRDAARRSLLERHVNAAEVGLAAVLDRLPLQLIHNDANDYNVLVDRDGDPGLIDFGDLVFSWRVGEVAVALAYAMLDHPAPQRVANALVAGYYGERPLTDEELIALPHLIALRLCISVVNSAERARSNPGDAYLVISEAPAWRLLQRLDDEHPRFTTARLRAACGLEPSPRGAALSRWLGEQTFAPVMDLSGGTTRFDISVGTRQFDGMLDPTNPALWTMPFTEALAAANATVGVGGYLESRLCYLGPRFETSNEGPERGRAVHLGVDLFANAGTPVRAPLSGVVHSVADNAHPLDYGPTLLLEHSADGAPFYTLYGHLDRLPPVSPGQQVSAGEVIGALGAPPVNGGWPPHLHFQVISDLFDQHGDYQGVGLASDRAVWASLCPDPGLVLGVDTTSQPAELGERRSKVLGPSLSLSYQRPLHIVRGVGAYLFDADGGRYLDGVNNVCHVGHCHPRVVRAAQQQLSVLNTNTRYLHEHVVRYAERLTATLPDGLDVCYLVNSGSEANDLALRMARAFTRRSGVIVVDAAYHGNLGALVDISPYKFDGPGGAGAPPHVRVMPMPDRYRGTLRDAEATGVRYAADLPALAQGLEASGQGAAAFIAESVLSCGGQIVLPGGYLAAAYQHARAAGAVCIADEVQTGFGRVGTDFWAFQTQSVVPDIVTMGKPIGNGFPIGAVVTTRAIAESFANGMEHFNTYGGNPVASAVGLSVLAVIRDEGLQQRALQIGAHLRAGLQDLALRHPFVGDVRGLGLFLGVEFVRDPLKRLPAPEAASYIVNRLRERGVLLSTDGPDHNVIKIKPPLVISREDVDELLDILNDVAGEDPLQVIQQTSRRPPRARSETSRDRR